MRSTRKSLTKRGVGGADTALSTFDDRDSMGSPQKYSQSPSAGNDVERNIGAGAGVGRSSNKRSNSSRFVSPKEKANFNARLEERRKQRRDQRTRRRKLHNHQRRKKGGFFFFRSKVAFMLSCIFCMVVGGWIILFLCLSKNMSFRNTKVKSPLQLENRGELVKQLANDFKNGVVEKIPKRFRKKSQERKNEKKNSGNDGGGGKEHFNNDFSNLVDKLPERFRNTVGELPHGQKRYGSNDVRGVNSLLLADEDEVIDMRIMSAELPFSDVDGGAWKQGFDVQPIELTSDKPLRIFVVPHSHCDPGWIKTFDKYFQTQTKKIITSVVESLLKDPRRKFIWAEISYFEWWWTEQSQETKKDVKKLLENKQFEFVTGGWVQPDEANTQLYAMEIQLQEGHDFIRETFGEEYIPKYGWSIDPFGYSPTMAYLLKKYGFKGMLIQRVHYAIKKELAIHKNLEFMWRQTWDDHGDHDIFTHVMPFYSYDVPHTCGPDPKVCCQFDFARTPLKTKDKLRQPKRKSLYERCPWKSDAELITDKNIEKRSLLLLDQYRKKANLYRTNVVIAPLGDDFRFKSVLEADLQFENYQKIFDYINENVENVEISFGTLSDYFETVMSDRPFSPPVLKGAFFTYADREEDYWSGYYTSRIFDKALDRKLERVLFAATSMGATKKELQGPRRALSLFQHHDGVTGTAKTNVVKDYAKRIDKAIHEAQNWILQHLVSDRDHDRSKRLAKELKLMACFQSVQPRSLPQNLCEQGSPNARIIVYNPLETDQYCGEVVVPGRTSTHANLPCEIPGPLSEAKYNQHQKLAGIQFHPKTGLMTHPVKEEWMVWKVDEGGAYLFFPGTLEKYEEELEFEIRDGGTTVLTKHWKRTVIERKLRKDENGGQGGIAIDFVYETFLQSDNEEWFARFTSPQIKNQGVFHTDLNGFNYDTHQFRSDMPIQSQVFPMPTLASIEDSKQRMTVLSEHAQGAASIEESVIDVWLDRRLAQDDERGLGEGVTDNVPTRTRLRIVLENTPTQDTTSNEFSITPFCKLQWEELNHPLEMFGSGTVSHSPFANAAHAFGMATDLDSIELDNRSIEVKERTKLDPHAKDRDTHAHGQYDIVAVYMVYKRTDYLKKAIDTLRESDYPKNFPIVISHDGHNKEIVEYVESIKSEFKIIQLFHPFSCSEHPDTFPGDDPKLNENYKGDTYGNKRESKITCCKHHFSWMINEVFSTKFTMGMDGFLFLEEDYIVAPTVYENIQKGFTYIDSKGRQEEFFGLALDPTDGYAFAAPAKESGWVERQFVTGPMVIRRDVFAKIKNHAKDFCRFDDYNWDWSLVHLMTKGLIPFKILCPSSLQTAHIGLQGGMHGAAAMEQKRIARMNNLLNEDGKLEAYHRDVGVPHVQRVAPPNDEEGFGGWGHPADQEHCMEVFGDTQK